MQCCVWSNSVRVLLTVSRANEMASKHSIKVPTQYKVTAKILKTALEKKKSIKTLIYEEKHARIRNLQAVLSHYSNNRGAINDAIEKTGILRDNPRLDSALCKVLIAELIYGRKQLKGESRPVQTVREYQERLQEALSGVETPANKAVWKPRYVRINTNLYSIEQALAYLAKNGWHEKNLPDSGNYDDFLASIKELDEKEFMQDMHVAGLLIFSRANSHYWASHSLVTEKKFILQDKATCLAIELLQPPPGATVLDMCAAPGMKTLHMSNVMANKGKIYSVEFSTERYNSLCKTITAGGCNIVEPINCDALILDKARCPEVEYILVDPSCSGSGMQNRIQVEDEEKDEARLYKLAGLQIKILSHAMKAFPNAKRILYCTCSLYEEENEQVVQRCLESNPKYKLLSCKKALRKKWHNVGNSEYKKIGKNCLYALPDKDHTDGIFLALFERRRDDDDGAAD